MLSRNASCKVAILLVLLLGVNSFAKDRSNDDRYFAKDKLQHFTLSAFMSAGIGFVAKNHFDVSEDKALIIGFTASFSLGGLKEVYDSTDPHEHSSIKDLTVDFLGSFVGAAVLAVFIK